MGKWLKLKRLIKLHLSSSYVFNSIAHQGQPGREGSFDGQEQEMGYACVNASP
jgi:hypothetical protein